MNNTDQLIGLITGLTSQVETLAKSNERLTEQVRGLTALVQPRGTQWQKPGDAVISLGLVEMRHADNKEKIRSAVNVLLRRRKSGVLKLGKHYRFAGGNNSRLQYNVPECNKVLGKVS